MGYPSVRRAARCSWRAGRWWRRWRRGGHGSSRGRARSSTPNGVNCATGSRRSECARYGPRSTGARSPEARQRGVHRTGLLPDVAPRALDPRRDPGGQARRLSRHRLLGAAQGPQLRPVLPRFAYTGFGPPRVAADRRHHRGHAASGAGGRGARGVGRGTSQGDRGRVPPLRRAGGRPLRSCGPRSRGKGPRRADDAERASST